MEKLFPNPTPYELINNNLIDISFNLVKTMEMTLNKKNDQKKKIFKPNSNIIFSLTFLIFYFLFLLKVHCIYKFILQINYSI